SPTSSSYRCAWSASSPQTFKTLRVASLGGARKPFADSYEEEKAAVAPRERASPPPERGRADPQGRGRASLDLHRGVDRHALGGRGLRPRGRLLGHPELQGHDLHWRHERLLQLDVRE